MWKHDLILCGFGFILIIRRLSDHLAHTVWEQDKVIIWLIQYENRTKWSTGWYSMRTGQSDHMAHTVWTQDKVAIWLLQCEHRTKWPSGYYSMNTGQSDHLAHTQLKIKAVATVDCGSIMCCDIGAIRLRPGWFASDVHGLSDELLLKVTNHSPERTLR